MNNLVVVATIVVKEDKVDFMKAEFQKIIEPTRAEAGNVEYRVHQDLKQVNRFVAYEIWQDAEAGKAHMETEHIKNFVVAYTEQAAIESFDSVVLSEI